MLRYTTTHLRTLRTLRTPTYPSPSPLGLNITQAKHKTAQWEPAIHSQTQQFKDRKVPISTVSELKRVSGIMSEASMHTERDLRKELAKELDFVLMMRFSCFDPGDLRAVFWGRGRE